MTRKYIDRRENPDTARQCTLAISADSDQELIEAAVDHAVKVHGYEDTPDVREQMKDAIQEGEPRT